ncbi:MAG: hypothetical protein JWQ27_1761 [Ferruginibacter sp.]|nr:hypothetical protein [Ferruginibacter sp.]
MQNQVLYLAPPIEQGAAREVLSFAPFLDYLRQRRDATDKTKNRFFSYVVEQFEQHPELLSPIDVTHAVQYPEQLQLIYNLLAAIVEDEDKQLWALCMPVQPTVFYSSNAFSRLITTPGKVELKKEIIKKDPMEFQRSQLETAYSVVLEKCYGVPCFFPREMIHSLHDDENGLLKFYRMALDTRFIEVELLGPLPAFDLAALQAAALEGKDALQLLQERLPLDLFGFHGFGIIDVTEVTAQYAIENIKDIIVNKSATDEAYYPDVIRSLKALMGNKDIDFGLLPVLQVNGKLIFNDEICMNSQLMLLARKQGVAEQAYLSLAEEYFRRPHLIFYNDVNAVDETAHRYAGFLKADHIHGYALLPVYFNKYLCGVLEVYSRKKGLLTENLLTRLDPAIPLLSQLLKTNIDEFNASIDRVIKEKFTVIQPSVQWKFNDVAWHYLRERDGQKKAAELQEVFFEKVHPLYGAIDVRNSTVERNMALNKDLGIEFGVLIDVFEKLKEASGFGLLDEKIFSCKKWLARIRHPSGFTREGELNQFLEEEIRPFLQQFSKGHPQREQIVQAYYDATNEETGVATESQRQLETSMNTVIAAVNDLLEKMQASVQQSYPCYFEKFRTDGVEYDIYIGQSIAPDLPFSEIYLNNLRLLQLSSMAEIARHTHALLKGLQRPVETTQLIFIHAHPIDIKFRQDEKRFDVEGAYNIRYHVVKKRIDKVSVKGSMERLTQPNKIAMVYFNQKEADEYISYIRYLQGQKILEDDLENLVLQELQGISGLRALRVGVRLSNEP